MPPNQKYTGNTTITMSSFDPIPLEAIILYRKGLEMSSTGNHEASIKYLNNAVMIAPRFTTALCEMGHCYENLGRFTDAVANYDKVLKMHPTHMEAGICRDRILEKIGHPK